MKVKCDQEITFKVVALDIGTELFTSRICSQFLIGAYCTGAHTRLERHGHNNIHTHTDGLLLLSLLLSLLLLLLSLLLLLLLILLSLLLLLLSTSPSSLFLHSFFEMPVHILYALSQ